GGSLRSAGDASDKPIFREQAIVVPVSALATRHVDSRRAQRRHRDVTEPGLQRTSWLHAEASRADPVPPAIGLPLVGSFCQGSGRRGGAPRFFPSDRAAASLTP